MATQETLDKVVEIVFGPGSAQQRANGVVQLLHADGLAPDKPARAGSTATGKPTYGEKTDKQKEILAERRARKTEALDK